MKKILLQIAVLLILGFAIIVAACSTNNLIFALIFVLYLVWLNHFYNSVSFEKYRCRIDGYIKGRKLKHKGKNLVIRENAKLLSAECIEIGDNCSINDSTVFAPLVYNNGKKYSPQIRVGDRVHFGSHDRIAAMDSVIIDDDVLFAAFVHVSDHSHEYRNVGDPVRNQGVFSKGPVHIKKGAWIGFGAHILSGVTIGEYSVVAANSVVTKDVPPYTVVAGNPARVVSTYNFELKEWEKIKGK